MTLLSMTGFGRSESASACFAIVVELKSVNQKGLDIRVRAPRELAIESDVSNYLRPKVTRGRLEVAIDVTWEEDDKTLLFDDERAGEALEVLRAFATKSGIADEVRLSDVLRTPGIFRSDAGKRDFKSARAEVLECLERATASFLQSREHEGGALKSVLAERLKTIAALVLSIEDDGQGVPQRLKERLEKRLDAIASDSSFDPRRLEQEVALLAERADVSEEVERLKAHHEHFGFLMKSPPAGRRLDFLCQELLREANTVASKCQHAKTAHAVVELKAEIERLREQVQNVE